jgi:Mg-chelatase subunit ChlD
MRTDRCRRLVALVFMFGLAPTLRADKPMRVALLVDTSAATAGAIVQLRAAISAFLDALPPEHEVLLVTTGRHTQVRVPPTVDRAKLKGNVAGLLSDGGPTALMDALTEVDERFMRKSELRWPVFVVITGDGSENSKDVDDNGFNRWVGQMAQRGVSANALVLKTGNGLPDAIASMIAKATHGHYAAIGNGGSMMQAMTQLAGQLTEDARLR